MTVTGKQRKIIKSIAWLLPAVLVAGLAWSFATESLPVHLARRDYGAALLATLAFLLMVAATGLIVTGGIVFLRDTARLFGRNKRFRQDVRIVQTRELPADTPPGRTVLQARRDNLRLLCQAWKAGFLWIASGFALMYVAGFLLHLAEATQA
ncbi:MAG: hypothetical protein FJZ96_03945 [Chloroflexi bacterium]|nr:hypothetical protein [Chloroflexota bacterium]